MVIQLIHSITHDGKVYSRGLYDTKDGVVTDKLAKFFLDSAPWAATIYQVQEIAQPGKVTEEVESSLKTFRARTKAQEAKAAQKVAEAAAKAAQA